MTGYGEAKEESITKDIGKVEKQKKLESWASERCLGGVVEEREESWAKLLVLGVFFMYMIMLASHNHCIIHTNYVSSICYQIT